MCTCDTDPRIRANHQNFPENCEHQAGFTGCGFGASPSYAHPQGWTDPYGQGHYGEPHYGESFSGYEGEFPQGHTEPYGVRMMDPWSTSFTGAEEAADASGSGDDGDPAETSSTLPTTPVSDGVQVIEVPVAVSPRHVWRRRNGTTFSTVLGSPRDRRAKHAARVGRVTLVSGDVFTGAPIAPIPNEILFTVTHPGGAIMRWQDGSVQDAAVSIPYGSKFRGVLRPRELIEVTSPGFTGWVNVYETQQIGPAPSIRGDFYTGADPWGDLAPTCPPGKTWQANTLQCVPMIPAPQPEQLAQLHPVTKGYYAGADPWGDLAPTCPPGKTWQANTLQCVPSIPAPQPEHLEPLRPVTKGDFAGMDPGGDYVYPGGFPEWGYDYPGFWVGAAATTTPVVPAAQAQAHADNAKVQAQSAKEVAEHPTANAPAKKAASASMAHATQAHSFAKAAAANPVHAAHYAHEAGRHASAAALEARRAHGHLHREHEREGIFGRLFGRGRGVGYRGRGRAFGRVGRSRFFHPEWRGVGHPNWRRGVGARWMHFRAECLMRHRYGCLKERIYSPQGYMMYRVTPAGAMLGIQLEALEQAANVQYVQTTGLQAPSTDDGPMQGSDQSADGSQTPAEGDAEGEEDTSSDDTASTDDAATDDTLTDAAADTSDTAATGEFTGWDMFFTDPYGNYDQRLPPAWDSGYAYSPDFPWGSWNW